MLDEHDGVLLAKVLQHLHRLLRFIERHTGGWFVEQQQTRACGDDQADLETLFVAVRERGRLDVLKTR